MLTSKAVFEERKTGNLNKAYNMAVELVQTDSRDAWNIKALAWCLIDMIKDASANNVHNLTQRYLAELDALAIDPSDEILLKSIAHVKQLTDPNQKIILDAKNLSKHGRHNEAINLYRQALIQFPNNIELHESLGWELYRVGKQIFFSEKINVHLAQQLLGEYLNLKNIRPSLLHSLFLRYADRLIGQESFHLVEFLLFWNLENLTEDDFSPYVADNGNVYKSIAEKIIQHAAKDALNRNLLRDIEYIFPYVEQAIERFPENFWLIYYKVKLLHAMNKNEESLEYSLLVVKNKIDQFWAWDLLAEILLNIDVEKSFSCYSKALQCKAEDKFLANVRINFAKLLLEKNMFNEAKYEVNKAIHARENEGWKITEVLSNYQKSEWYVNAISTNNNNGLYKKNTALAESLLFDTVDWLKATVGDKFIITSKPNKPKRKIFIKIENELTPIEISVPENKYNFDLFSVGDGIKVKGEYDREGKFQLYLLEDRGESLKWDIFPEYLAVIDHINIERKIAHFIVDKNLDGIMRFSDFKMQFKVADKFLIRVTTYKNDQGIRYNVLTCLPTEEELNQTISKQFSGFVRVSDGLAFTDDDIFIDKDLVREYNINDDNEVSGLAVINYNKKRARWGMESDHYQ